MLAMLKRMVPFVAYPGDSRVPGDSWWAFRIAALPRNLVCWRACMWWRSCARLQQEKYVESCKRRRFCSVQRSQWTMPHSCCLHRSGGAGEGTVAVGDENWQTSLGALWTNDELLNQNSPIQWLNWCQVCSLSELKSLKDLGWRQVLTKTFPCYGLAWTSSATTTTGLCGVSASIVPLKAVKIPTAMIRMPLSV